MPIPFTRYVNITSGIGAGTEVRRRELIARLFTTDDQAPPDTNLEFDSAAAVGDFFGSDTQEFLRAQFYFGFVSKNITRPKRISFYRWVDADANARIYGGTPGTLDQLTAITSGTFSLTIGGTTEDFTGIDLSSASTLLTVASEIQTIVQTGTGTQFTAATVTYNPTRSRFELVSGEAENASISVSAGDSEDVAGLLGWLSGATLANGKLMQSITDTLTDSSEVSNNFGSYEFIDTLTQDQVVESATWNNGQNNLYQYMVGVSRTDAEAYSQALIDLAGTGMTLLRDNVTNQYPEMLPMAVLAATDYERQNSVQNYMFQSANLTPSVTTGPDATTYDNLRINYYGSTQTAGQIREFYQRGVLTGNASTVPVDMNTYANEQWLKDDAGARIMSLLLSLARVPANPQGEGQLLNVIQETVNQALLNGTISVGRTISQIQQVFITETTNDPLAYQQVATSGYWLNVTLDTVQTPDNRTEYRGVYTLIYTKDDAIRMVEGTHILI